MEEGLFANLTRLESLELNNCDLKTPIDPKVFGDRLTTDIIELKLSGNSLEVPDDGPLLPTQLSNLEILDLSNCNLTHLNENLFTTTKNLTQLNLSSNTISGTENLACLKKLRMLEHLDLSNNSLSTVNRRVFKFNSRLLSVNLLGNPFVCNCFITDMWDWAVQVKNDLHVLVGSQPANFETGAAKLRKSLSCTYDDDTYRQIEQARASGDRPSRKGDLSRTRTWAKYVRESNCGRSL